MAEKEKPKDATKELVVLEALPQQQVREVLGEDGKEYIVLTRDEAIKEILEHIRVIRKNLGN